MERKKPRLIETKIGKEEKLLIAFLRRNRWSLKLLEIEVKILKMREQLHQLQI